MAVISGCIVFLVQVNVSINSVIESGENIVAVLTIPDIGLEDGGRYICSAIRGDDSSQTESFIAITGTATVVKCTCSLSCDLQ